MRRPGGLVLSLAILTTACSPSPQPAQTPTSTTAPGPTTATTTPATVATGNTVTTGTTTTTEPLDPLLGLALDVVAEGLSRPVIVVAPPGDARLFIGLREGKVLIADQKGNLNPEPFLNITDVVFASGIEQGLLGMVFHPNYSENGHFFVYFTDGDGDTRLVEFTVGPDADAARRDSERTLLVVDQPTDRHNGGGLVFGPDGYLYVGLGEGGAARSNAQNPGTFLGSILRLDVEGEAPYGIPPDNPFVDEGGAPEVWAYGLRNPWRIAIDPVDRLLYIGDVGHERWEEIDVVSLDAVAPNFGWLIMEGNHCFSPSCDATGLVPPVVEYGHEEGCSVTGGMAYRGSAIPELVGHYFYGDWCGGWVRSFRFNNGLAATPQDWSEDLGDVGQINTFGVDGFGELYLATWEGVVARIVPLR